MATLRQVIDTTAELAGLTYPEVADWLNDAPPVDNPTPRANVPAPVTLEQVMALVPSAERIKVRREPGFIEELRVALGADNRSALAVLLEDAVTAQAITAGTAAKLQPLLTATIPDPDWAAQIPGAPRWQAAGLPGPVSAADVQGAIHATAE